MMLSHTSIIVPSLLRGPFELQHSPNGRSARDVRDSAAWWSPTCPLRASTSIL